MASLNTLRTRFGVVLSIIIAFALLAFILSLKTDMGLSGNDPKVGVIDGSKIRYSEYIEVYNNLKDQSNISESNEEQMDQLAEMAWQTLIANHVYLPGFEKMGISVTDAEREGLISGEYYSGTMAAAFTDPRTGQYSVEGVSEEDRSLAARALKEYGNLRMDTDVMRCKLYAILLPAYTILGMEEEAAKLVGVMQTMLPLVKAEQSRALAVVTLYGCTDSSIYYHLAHEAVDPWKKEEKPKKSKQQLINRLDDYDRWLRH